MCKIEPSKEILEYLKKLMKEYKNKLLYDPIKGEFLGDTDASLESFWIPKQKNDKLDD